MERAIARLPLVYRALIHVRTVELFKSSRPPLHKLLWALLVFIFPIVGVIVYWLLSDRKKYNDQGYEVLP